MKSIFFKFNRVLFILVGIIVGMTGPNSYAQTNSNEVAPPAPLNLDARRIAKEISKEEPLEPAPEKISVEPNRMDESFTKAEKHGLIPTVVEINTPGTPERVTKVNGAGGAYCVYSPTVGRTDGVDDIQNGEQTQVRTCPN